jgi:hypothetical protein
MDMGWDLEFDDGFRDGMALIRTLERHYGAQIIGYDVDPTGEIVVDVRFDGGDPAVRAVRTRDRESRTQDQREVIRARRRWAATVQSHTETVRDLLRHLRRERDLTS